MVKWHRLDINQKCWLCLSHIDGWTMKANDAIWNHSIEYFSNRFAHKLLQTQTPKMSQSCALRTHSIHTLCLCQLWFCELCVNRIKNVSLRWIHLSIDDAITTRDSQSTVSHRLSCVNQTSNDSNSDTIFRRTIDPWIWQICQSENKYSL